ncbi:MAG: hypothetical protein KJ737_06585 [Proteobacteria bacterium]|nr:hypothetical protein [Pseudomonadota bacterium]
MNQPIYLTNTVQMIMAILLCLTSISIVQGAGEIDTCALLTNAEIQAATGQEVTEVTNPNANAVGIPCRYVIGSDGVFSIMAKTVRAEETADKVEAELKKKKIPVLKTPGVGDHSFFSSPGYGMIELNTFKDSNYLIITIMVPGASEAGQKTIAENLMRKALTKL